MCIVGMIRMKTATTTKRAKRTRPARRPRKHRVRADNEGGTAEAGAAKSGAAKRGPAPAIPQAHARVATFTEMLDLSNEDIDKAFERELQIERMAKDFTKSELKKRGVPKSDISKEVNQGQRNVRKLMLDTTLFTDRGLADRRKGMVAFDARERERKRKFDQNRLDAIYTANMKSIYGSKKRKKQDDLFLAELLKN
eukprot:jgi/Mesvir1/22116/Mv18719-RA.1